MGSRDIDANHATRAAIPSPLRRSRSHRNIPAAQPNLSPMQRRGWANGRRLVRSQARGPGRVV
jgi:hypothetical protein